MHYGAVTDQTPLIYSCAEGHCGAVCQSKSVTVPLCDSTRSLCVNHARRLCMSHIQQGRLGLALIGSRPLPSHTAVTFQRTNIALA